MRVAIIGRTEILYETALSLAKAGHQIVCILTAKEAPEYVKSATDFSELAKFWQIPFSQGSKIVEQYEFLSSAHADIAVSINYSGVIPDCVIDLFPLGILNAHGGDLPRYRGNACQAWAILNGEDKVGLCVHKMIGGELDSGNIIARDYLMIDHRTKVTRIWEWMLHKTPELMLDAVERLSQDPSFVLEVQSKELEDALRCYPRNPEDGRIDWRKQAIDVLRLINASNKPYSGAFCELNDNRLIIWDAELVEDGEIFCAVPGQVTKIGSDFFEVACGVGKLKIITIEYENKIVSPSSLVRSVRTRLK